MKRFFPWFMILFILMFCLLIPQRAMIAQNAPVHCGDIIKGELTKSNQIEGYPIVLSPGDKLTLSGQADGNPQIDFGFWLESPGGTRIFPRGGNMSPSPTPFLVTGGASAYGIHTIYVFNTEATGSYQIGISCELHDGIVVAAGESDSAPQMVTKPNTITLPISGLLSNSLKQLQCGDVFTTEFDQNDQIHTYALEMIAGDVSFQITVTPFGSGLYTAMEIFGPDGKFIDTGAGTGYVGPAPLGNISVSLPGNYQIVVSNSQLNNGKIYIPGNEDYMGGVGIYTLQVSCVLKGNQVVSPDAAKLAEAIASISTSQIPFSGTGFPGLAAVDFSAVAKIPLIAGSPMAGAVTATGGETIGFTFDANAGDKVDLTFSRIQPGNLNLGLAVLSPDNKVVFQASLVTSESLTTRFTLPSAGTYTIGVFRIDLLPPDNPQPTAFQVQAALNP